jgi:hypothetical protein
MTKKKVTTKGKAEGSKRARRFSVKRRAQLIVSDFKNYDEETRNSIKNSLDGDGSDLSELVRRAEAGETIHDASKPPGEAEGQKQTEWLQPRNDREQRLVDETLERADEMRLARAMSAARGVSISPHTTNEQKEGAANEAARLDYAQTVYGAALDYYDTNRADPFRLRRFPFVYGEADPADVHIVVTLPRAIRHAVADARMVAGWIDAAETIALTLEDPECNGAFTDAVGALVAEHLLESSGLGWATPAVLRVLLPLALIECSDDDPAGTDEIVRVFNTLREALNSVGLCERASLFTAYPYPTLGK